MVVPALAEAGPLLLIERSAWGVIAVNSVCELFAAFGSPVAELMAAVMLIDVPVPACAVTLSGAVPPTPKAPPSVQVCAVGVPLQVHEPAVAVIVPPERESVIEGEAAGSGPLLVGVIE